MVISKGIYNCQLIFLIILKNKHFLTKLTYSKHEYKNRHRPKGEI